MADFRDLEDSQSVRWQEILLANNIKFVPDLFPWTYYAKSFPKKMKLISDADHEQSLQRSLQELAQSEPKKAVCQLFYYALLAIAKENSLDFITRRELNLEFNDLVDQALQYGISIP